MQARNGPVSNDARAGEDHHPAGPPAARSRCRPVPPVAVRCDGGRHQVLDRLVRVQRDPQLDAARGRQVGQSGQQSPRPSPPRCCGRPRAATPGNQKRHHLGAPPHGRRAPSGGRPPRAGPPWRAPVRPRGHRTGSIRGVDTRDQGHASPELGRGNGGHDERSTMTQPRLKELRTPQWWPSAARASWRTPRGPRPGRDGPTWRPAPPRLPCRRR